jgi:hypothetical protein
MMPYQIQRTRLVEDVESDVRYYRFDLINTATDKVIAHAFSRSPIAPSRLRHRLGELNSRHLLNELAIY